MDGPEPFLRRAEIAKFMGVSVRMIDYWAAQGCPHETWGMRTKTFRPSEVVAWAKQRGEAKDGART